MLNREIEPSPEDKDGILLEMAFMFDGVDYCNGGTREELQRAKKILIDQHRKVMPKFTREKVYVLAQNDSLINAFSQTFHNALLKDNLSVALGSLNSLHAFGNMDYNDSLGGKAFAASLEAHRAFAKKIFNDFIDYSQHLSPLKKSMLVEIAHYREQREPAKELSKLREIIHLTTLHGVLGEDPKRQFDPFALKIIEK